MRRKEDDDEREALKAAVREWTEKYDGVLRVQEALQQDGEETERENRKLAHDIFELKEKIGQLEEEREKEYAALQQLREQQQQQQPQQQLSSQPAAAEQKAEEHVQTELASPTHQPEPEPAASVAPVEPAALSSDVTVAETESAVDEAATASATESASDAAPTAEQTAEETAATATAAVYSEEYVRSMYEQSVRDREQLIAYYTGFLTQRDTELQQLHEQLAAAQARLPSAPPTLQPSGTHIDTVVASAERDTTHLSSTEVEQQDIVEPAVDQHAAESEEERRAERKEREEGAPQLKDPLVSPGVPPAFLDEMPIGSPATFSLNGHVTEPPLDGDAMSFTLQPVTPLSPLSTPLSPASQHSTVDSHISHPPQPLPYAGSAAPSLDAPPAAASNIVSSGDADTGVDAAAAAADTILPSDAVAQWQAAVADRDERLAAVYGDLNAWIERYGAIYAEYERLTAQVAALIAAQASQAPAAASSAAASVDAAVEDEARTEPEVPSRAASDTPAELQEAATAEVVSPSYTQLATAALTVPSPAPDYGAELEQHRQQLYEAEHERSRLREENEDLRYRMEELRDKQAQLEQQNQQLMQQQQSSSAQEAASSSHLLHLSLLQQEMQTAQAAVDERDRFITLTLARIAAYQKDKEEGKRKEEQRRLKEKEQQAKQGGGFKLFGGGKKAELRPEDDDTMEWNGREWVKKPDEDAVSALLPLPAKPKPLSPSALPSDLASLSVDELIKRMGLKTSAGSPATAGVFSTRSPPAGTLMPGRPNNAYAAAKPKTVSARYASSFDDFGFEGDNKSAQPSMSPTISAVLSPPPPDAADLSTNVFVPSMPAAAVAAMPAASSIDSASRSDDTRLQGRSVSQLLDALDAASATIASLEQQLAITSSLPRPIPSPSPDQPVVDGLEMAHLRGQLRVKEEEKVALEMALAQEREHVAALDRKIEQMRAMEAGLIDGREDDEHDEPAAEADESAMDAAQLLVRVRALRHKYDRVHRQLQMARQRMRELEVDKERHSHGSVSEQEEQAKREAAMASLQRDYEAVLRERDGLCGERDQLLHQLQQAMAAASHATAAATVTDTSLVRRSSAAGASDAQSEEVLRLRAMVSELQRHVDSERMEASPSLSSSSPSLGADSGGVSSAGSVLTASVRINYAFLVSFVLLLLAVLGMQVAKPEWMGGELLDGGAGSAGGSGGVWPASREL